MPESPRCANNLQTLIQTLIVSSQRWLIDSGRDEEGMIVIADLHGGDMNGTVAKAEFNEIKDKVVAEVCHCVVLSPLAMRSQCFVASFWGGPVVQNDVEEISKTCIISNVLSGFCTTCKYLGTFNTLISLKF